MPRPPRISEAEWEVMEAIWSRHPITAQDIVETLGPERDWKDQTIRTMLARLVKKGALSTTPEGKRYLYRPLFTREQCVRNESSSFLEKVFDGASASLLLHFVQNTRLNKKEIAELKKLLDEKGRE